MKPDNLKKALSLYAVTDRHWLKDETLSQVVEKAIQGGASFVQLREKNASAEEFLQLALDVQKVCKKYNVPFVLNDNVELAAKIGADGVHVGQSDMNALNVRAILGEDKIIGVSAHNVEEAVLAEKQGADYLGAGAVFSTSSKDNVSALSYDTLKAITSAVKIPVIAIGGINEENMKELKGSGICGVAVISAIFGKGNITGAAADLKKKVDEYFWE